MLLLKRKPYNFYLLQTSVTSINEQRDMIQRKLIGRTRYCIILLLIYTMRFFGQFCRVYNLSIHCRLQDHSLPWKEPNSMRIQTNKHPDIIVCKIL